VHDFFGGQRVHQPELVDIDRHAPCGLADPEIIESMEGVGSELNSSSDLSELRRLFQHQHIEPFLRESKGRREPADAARLPR